MAQVPYSPVPNVSSNLQPTPQIHVDTPPAAFGANVADAVKGLGAASDQVGNELFSRAMAMQDLHNQSVSDAASTGFQQDLAQVHAKFINQYGENAGPDALSAYAKQVADLRGQYREGLDNPMAQRYYDQQTRNIASRIYFQAADHSAQQLKATAIATTKANGEAATNLAMVDPASQANVEAAATIREQSERENGARLGQDPATIDNNVAVARSDVYSKQIRGLLDAGMVDRASAIMEQYKKDGKLRGEDIGALTQSLTKAQDTIGAKVTADGINSGASLAMGKGQVPIQRAMDAIGAKESGGNYTITGPELPSGDQALGKYGVMRSNLPAWLDQAGLPHMTQSEFLANPSAQDKVFQTVFGGYMQKYGSANEAAVKWFTGKSISEGGEGNRADALGTTPPRYLADFNKNLAKVSTTTDKAAVARSEVATKYPNNPLAGDYAENQIQTEDAAREREQRQTDAENLNTVNDVIVKSQIAGQPISDINAIKAASPEAKAAIEAMSPTDQLKLQVKLKDIQSHDNNPSPEREANNNRFMGMATADPESFKQTDLYGQNLRSEERQNLLKIQKEVIAGKTVTDPLVTSAMKDNSILTSLNAAGISRTTAGGGDVTEYHKFIGALTDEVQVYRQAGKSLSPQDVRDMATKLLQQQAVPENRSWLNPGGIFGEHTEPLYAAQPPTTQVPQLRQEFSDRYKRQPSDEEIQRYYSRKLFSESLGATK